MITAEHVVWKGVQDELHLQHYLHYTRTTHRGSVVLWLLQRKRLIKMETIDENYYLNVWECMQNTILHEPRLKRKIVYDGIQFLPIKTIEVSIWE